MTIMMVLKIDVGGRRETMYTLIQWSGHFQAPLWGPPLCTYQCNAPLPQVWAEGGGWSGLVPYRKLIVGESIAVIA